jgi:hypothetical protein
MAKHVEEVNNHPAPTYRFETTHGPVTIKTALYGEVTPERIAAEKARGLHRAQQLDPRR